MADPATGELAQFVMSHGFEGSLAAILFWFYRKDIRSYTELWKETSSALLVALKDSSNAQRDVAVAMTRNAEIVKSLHRRLDAIEQDEHVEGRRRSRT